MNSFLISLDKILETDVEYFASSENFFSQFSEAWNQVKNQVLKLETRQEYLEPGNPSFEMMISGNFDAAVKLVREAKTDDDEIYRTLKEKGVDIIRCRPVKYPFTQYLKWEFETYKYSAQKLERIFCCSWSETANLFETIATKDFMVFDSSVAFIHNYDSQGLIQGGWKINDPNHILILQSIFIHIKSFCSPFYKFLLD